MPRLERVRAFLEEPAGREHLAWLYRQETSLSLDRYRDLLDRFARLFPSAGEVEVASAPGRTEISGNHTDHENGRILAAAVTLDCVGVGARNSDRIIRLHSEGYPTMEVDLTSLEPQPQERNTPAALVRGIVHFFNKEGRAWGGFNGCLTSRVPAGSGLSSSAAFEILVAFLLDQLYGQGSSGPLTLARAGQFAETVYFGKPCGLMDQLTSAVGGFLSIDFKDPSEPVLHQVACDLSASGYELVILEAGGSHADLTADYAAVREENRSVARQFQREVLREVAERDFRADLPGLRSRVGDRALLRAMHFFEEQRRVAEQEQALEAGEFERFLGLVQASGRSSWMLLQNCTTGREPASQGIPLALAVTERFLEGQGACRVHGGGFAGTIQAYVPRARLDEYIQTLEALFGSGACRVVQVRPAGAVRLLAPTA